MSAVPRHAATAHSGLRALAALLVAGVLAGVACSDDPKPCIDSECPNGAHCFDGECRTPCAGTASCQTGESCKRVRTQQGFTGSLCIGEPRTPSSVGGESCADNDDCDVDFGFHCVDEVCVLTCLVHEHCGTLGSCSGSATDSDGDSVRLCEADEFPRDAGQYGTRCPKGDECDRDADFVCIGAGEGDVDAYCTRLDCASDDECPSGSYCSEQFVGARPCTDGCGFDGSSEDDCIPDDDIGDGRTYACGAVGLTRKLCLHREFCNECETDTDCAGLPNQVCARDVSGQRICTRLCDPALNSCPWGSAAVCGVWDEELGLETCSHRFGSCRGDGSSCHPCIDDADCPRGYCQETDFSGEHYCVDLAVSCSCPSGTVGVCTDGGCPLTPEPAALPMTCFGGSAISEADVRRNACIGASSPRAAAGEPDGCWPRL